MHFFAKCVSMSFADAVAVTRDALKRYQFSVMAEVDLSQALRKDLGVDFRPYLVLSACSLPMALRAIRADEAIGSILLFNVVVQEHSHGSVEISVADPTCTIGTINNVEMISIAQELQSLARRLMDDIEPVPKIHRAA